MPRNQINICALELNGIKLDRIELDGTESIQNNTENQAVKSRGTGGFCAIKKTEREISGKAL